MPPRGWRHRDLLAAAESTPPVERTPSRRIAKYTGKGRKTKGFRREHDVKGASSGTSSPESVHDDVRCEMNFALRSGVHASASGQEGAGAGRNLESHGITRESTLLPPCEFPFAFLSGATIVRAPLALRGTAHPPFRRVGAPRVNCETRLKLARGVPGHRTSRRQPARGRCTIGGSPHAQSALDRRC